MSEPRQQVQDELARRRAARHRHAGEASMSPDDPGEENKPPDFSWSDILAMIIAAYQILLPMVLAFIGVVVLIYFLFALVLR